MFALMVVAEGGVERCVYKVEFGEAEGLIMDYRGYIQTRVEAGVGWG